MSLTSLPFIGLCAATVLLYYLVPKKLQWLLLLFASCVFYSAGGLGAAGYLGSTILTTYIGGRLMGVLSEKKHRKAVAAFVCVVNFGLLALLKYAHLGLIMPLGISFYTFQSISYVLDCSKKKQEPEKNLLKYALFVSFFPQMVQGPVSRYGQLAPQLLAEHDFKPRRVKFGIQLALWGYMKKMIIADRASVAVAKVFSNYLDYDGSFAVLAVLLYSIQIYCDFSGGIDIIRGVAQMLGIHMTENFKRPFFAQSLADYWRRWHISLGSWMKDYVFYPLVLSKPFVKLGAWSRRTVKGRAGKLIPTAAATFAVYFVIGIWHGAGLKYLAFGLYNGIIITGSQLLEGFFTDTKKKLNFPDKHPVIAFLRMVRTFVLVFIGRYFSRAEGLMPALSMLKRSLLRFNLPALKAGWLSLGLAKGDYLIIALGFAVVLAVEIYQERKGSFREWLEDRSPFVQWLFMVIPLLLMFFFGLYRGSYISSEFIYKQF